MTTDLEILSKSNSPAPLGEDWDRSESSPDAVVGGESSMDDQLAVTGTDEGSHDLAPKATAKRSITELLRLYAEKGTKVGFSVEEASRVAEVLGQWINSESSPYEGEDRFFMHSQDDSSLGKKGMSMCDDFNANGRSVDQGESTLNSRTPGSAEVE